MDVQFNSITMKKFLFLTAFICLASLGYSQLYIGGGVGNSFYNQNITDINGESFKVKDNSLGWRAYAGFGAGFLSLEGGYRDLGTVTDEVSGISVESSVNGWDVAGRGKIKIGPLYGSAKAGAFFYSNDISWTNYSQSTNETSFMWGVGAGLALSSLNLGLSWESLNLNNDNTLSQLMLDVSFTLGGNK